MTRWKADLNRPDGAADTSCPPKAQSEWHAGERMMQRQAGSARVLEHAAARIFRSSLDERSRAFFAGLPFLVIGFVDDDDYPWGAVLPGKPGFVSSPEASLLRIDCAPTTGIPQMRSLGAGTSVGLLGIDLSTRRRIRVNGVVCESAVSRFTVQIRQCFGNCSKYIQERVSVETTRAETVIEARPVTGLDAEARRILAACDTFFVATFAPGSDGVPAVDVSHRGGCAGFVRMDGGTLTIPDFHGNGYFNTLGNIAATSRAGIAVPVFDTGDLLLLSGDARVGVTTEEQREAALLRGAERLWRLTPRSGWWLRAGFPARLQFRSRSPQTLAMGAWPSE